jgi:hypothetical protein
MHATSQRLILSTVFVAALAGCASSLEKVSGWMSSNADAFSVLDSQILRGKMNFARDREASLQLQTTTSPVLACSGPLRYTASRVGTVHIDCNDGRSGVLAFSAQSALSGTARGNVGTAQMLLTFGLAPDKAAAYLGLPVEVLAPAPDNSAPGTAASAN